MAPITAWPGTRARNLVDLESMSNLVLKGRFRGAMCVVRTVTL
jgi:hypothetical protein